VNRLSVERRARIVSLLVEGMSMRAVTRLEGVSINTVAALIGNLGPALPALRPGGSRPASPVCSGPLRPPRRSTSARVRAGPTTTIRSSTRTITPVLKNPAKHPFGPSATKAAAAGSVDRNGTTVNVTYLSTADAIRQRLVIVNRGPDVAEYFMTTFQTEPGVEVTTDKVSGQVPGRSRAVLRVWEELDIEGGSRAAGIVNVTAPTRDIDVMTVQWRTDTGNFDTTLYEAD